VAAPDGLGAIELFWVHGNHLGVPLVYSNDNGNAVAMPTDYLLPGFPGQSRVMSDLYYNRHRDYDSVTGRYIQADPIGLRGDVNPYAYAGADPVNMVDPLGLNALAAGAAIRAHPGFALIYGVGLAYSAAVTDQTGSRALSDRVCRAEESWPGTSQIPIPVADKIHPKSCK